VISRAEIAIDLAMRTLFPLSLCALAACGGSVDSTPTPPMTSAASAAARPAPVVELVDLAGLEARVGKRDGRPLLLNFWAMW
jgi:hypothetical protein